MKINVPLVVLGSVVLVVLGTVSTTGALWHETAGLNPGVVKTGTLELLVGGQPKIYDFEALSELNLAPGDAVSAPLTLRNGGTTALTYKLEHVATGPVGTAGVDLASQLTLLVTTKAACDGTVSQSGVHKLYEGPVVDASFEGCALGSLSSVDLDITVQLAETAPPSVSSQSVSATFIFKGDQVQ